MTFDLSRYKLRMDIDADNHIKNNIASIFQRFGIPNTTLEVGTYNGVTSLWLAETLAPLNPNYIHYCIDPYDHSVELTDDLEEVYEFFMYNKSVCPAGDRINHLRIDSYNGILELRKQNIKPEFIFIDGDHTASTVLNDLVLSFELLPSGGVILCDDTLDWKLTEKNGNVNRDPQMYPRFAVESFLMINWSKVEPLVLPCGVQTAFMKK